MSAVREQEKTASESSSSTGAIEIREGDWKAYMQHLGRYKQDKAFAERYATALDYKRACALAYLGRRAQLHGGVCSTRHPHIMTPQFLAELEMTNRSVRHARYPWLKSLMNLLHEIEQIQDQISPSNVFTLVPGSK